MLRARQAPIGMTLAYVETLRAGIAPLTATTTRRAPRSSAPPNVIAGLARAAAPRLVRLSDRRARAPRRRPAAARAASRRVDAIEFLRGSAADRALPETGTAIEPTRPSAPATSATRRPSASRARAESYVDARRGVRRGRRPVETARLATAESHLARARGDADPALDAAAADAWRAVARPYPVALAQLRRVGALVENGEREAAAAQLVEVSPRPSELGAPWFEAEAEGWPAARGCAADGRGRSRPPERRAPTRSAHAARAPGARARRHGATNREIGAQLFMAEKTASVHVSRILAKLDVRSRTEAAGVAHRLGLRAG